MDSWADIAAMAEAVEHARFDQLRQGTWHDLRDGERSTRVRILHDAMVTSGVAAEIGELQEQAARVQPLLEATARRDRDAAAALAEHDAEVVRLSDRIAALQAEVRELTEALAATEARAEAAEQVVDTVRGAVATLEPRADVARWR